MKTTAGEKTINKLIDNGWRVNHSALSAGYHYAGTIGAMRPGHNMEYCRVYHGKCTNVKMHGVLFSFQHTTVMCREAAK